MSCWPYHKDHRGPDIARMRGESVVGWPGTLAWQANPCAISQGSVFRTHSMLGVSGATRHNTPENHPKSRVESKDSVTKAGSFSRMTMSPVLQLPQQSRGQDQLVVGCQMPGQSGQTQFQDLSSFRPGASPDDGSMAHCLSSFLSSMPRAGHHVFFLEGCAFVRDNGAFLCYAYEAVAGRLHEASLRCGGCLP